MPCKVREGAEVKTSRDVQNLVTSAIFRQTKSFTFKDIQEAVGTRLEGSELTKGGKKSGEVDVDSVIKNTIEQLIIAGRIHQTEGPWKFELSTQFPVGPLVISSINS